MEAQYEFYQTIIDGSPCYINNTNIWDHTWNATGEITPVTDPLYGKLYNFEIYKINPGNGDIHFAAGEFSNNIWGIYCLVKA